MKVLSKISLLLAFTGFFACKKVENKVYFEGGTAPTIAANKTAVTLEPGFESDEAITFTWTNPDYRFNTGLSSQDVNYTLEIDTVGGNFSSGVKFSSVIPKDLKITYTVGELNTIMGNVMRLPLLDPLREYNFEARVISSIGNAVKLISSNKVAFKATPFPPPPKVPVPGEGNLWMTGDAVPSGWTPSPPDTQKFTKLSRTLYEIVIYLPGGGGYKLIQDQGDWDTQYHMLDGGNWAGGEFEKKNKDPQFLGPPEAGTYKITFDFQLGLFTAVKQ